MSHIWGTQAYFDDGYDSNDENGPKLVHEIGLFSAEEKGNIDTAVCVCNKGNKFVRRKVDGSTNTEDGDTDNVPSGVFVPIDDDVLKKMKNKELQQELKFQNLQSMAGNKAMVIERL